jgi:hypothetical protein
MCFQALVDVENLSDNLIYFNLFSCAGMEILPVLPLAAAPQPVATPCKASEKGNVGTPNLRNS